MSMLLDALKKSEEQRRLGARPDIHREAGDRPDDGSGPVRQWLPLALIVVSVLVMAWFGWQQFRPPAVVSGEPEVAVRTPSEGVTTPASEAKRAATTGGARTPVEDYAAPAPSAADADAGTDVAAVETPGREQREQALRSFTDYQAPGGEATESGPADVAEPAPEPDRAPRRNEPAEPYQPEAMSYWELPQGVRDSLPEFRVTVLVYADKPEDRFLLINGIRLKEKDELQSGVVLDEIRRDGAVFRARNYRFLVKG